MRRLFAGIILCFLSFPLCSVEAKTRAHPIASGCQDPNGWYRCGGGDWTGKNWTWEQPGQSKKRAYRNHSVEAQQIAYQSSDLVARARAYLGTNPTGWARLWCGRFMAMIAPDAARRVGNPNFARNWAGLPHTSPHVGAIAVIARKGGGHVGVVSGFDASGNPRVISGNHGRKVGEGVYPSSRIIAYVSAM